MTKNMKTGKFTEGPNGTLVCKVRVSKGLYKGHLLTFTQHSPDRYTVYGFSPLPSCGVSIERRGKYQDEVLRSHDSVRVQLRDVDQWVAHDFRANSYYGALAAGATAEEAYNNMFDRSSWFNT